ncbi:hypothetical protein HDU98_000256 [Podochytrium sp. JEL0797]|nr:hypothetical protein HDU98_000256 [Podochytrium sp. JEL0797]
MILMSHIDVVPVLPETFADWKYDPYSGFIDTENGKLWGRGSMDTKSTLMGILEAVEKLLEAEYSPGRTIYLAFGHDEESEMMGAFAIAQYLEHELNLAGKVGLIVDEGTGFKSDNGLNFAAVAVSEKGYTDVQIIVETKGGHSSIPPKHTAIGYTAQLINALESNPHVPDLSLDNPIVGSMACIARHAPNPSPRLVNAINAWPESRLELLGILLDTLPEEDVVAILETTMAVDVINGGLKVNALPEKVTTLVNHRIGAHDSVEGLQEYYQRVLAPVCLESKLNLTISEFGNGGNVLFEHARPDARGRVSVSSRFAVLQPSPVSPYNDKEDRGWAVLEGTIHHVFDAEFGGNLIVGPVFEAGNSDTKSYWNLSKSIYRFSPPAGGEIHTVDEWVSLEGFLKTIKFYHELIRNWSEAL